MRTLLILAIVAVIVMWALLVGGTIDDQPAVTPAPVVFHAESVFDPPPVIVTTSSTSSTTTTSTTTPRARTAPTERITAGNVWDRVAACESGGRWDDTRGGYEGGLHFMHATWLRAGGARFAPSANLASREQQITIAKAWLARTSVKQWPVCGPKAGLTMADAA